MANPEHVAKLLQGSEVWNKWIEKVKVQPKLSEANLRGASLSHANLYGADLVGADLSNADLTNANLSTANLRLANLRYANLENADLRGAFFHRAYVRGVNFKDSLVLKADFRNVSLEPHVQEMLQEGGAFVDQEVSEVIQDDILSIIVDPGSAPPEEIADVLSDLSILYRRMGGSGINFSLQDIHALEGEAL